MPITLPSWVNSGPPELPWLIGASIWMNWSYGPSPMSRLPPRRCRRSPCRRGRTGCPSPPPTGPASRWRIAEFDEGQLVAGIHLQHRDIGARIAADHLRRQGGAVVQRHADLLASFTTWLLVTIVPLALIRKPEPRASTGRGRPGRGHAGSSG